MGGKQAEGLQIPLHLHRESLAVWRQAPILHGDLSSADEIAEVDSMFSIQSSRFQYSHSKSFLSNDPATDPPLSTLDVSEGRWLTITIARSILRPRFFALLRILVHAQMEAAWIGNSQWEFNQRGGACTFSRHLALLLPRHTLT